MKLRQYISLLLLCLFVIGQSNTLHVHHHDESDHIEFAQTEFTFSENCSVCDFLFESFEIQLPITEACNNEFLISGASPIYLATLASFSEKSKNKSPPQG
ncbi:MAG: hypothetical protein VXX46_04535 [Bacteroidota bacterium]|nr:hypothetical protein [Bacteroidota bacterium]